MVVLKGRFHEVVAMASHDQWLLEFPPSLRAQTRLYRSSLYSPDRGRVSSAEHRPILEAIRRHESTLAEERAGEHVLRARDVAVRGDAVRRSEDVGRPEAASHWIGSRLNGSALRRPPGRDDRHTLSIRTGSNEVPRLRCAIALQDTERN